MWAATVAAPYSHSFPTPSTLDSDELWEQGAAVPPDDYLESSEELLKSLADEDRAVLRVNQDWVELLLTPGGIGTVLGLMGVSIVLSYLATQQSGGREMAGTLPQALNVATQPTASSAIPNAPNLAAGEFE
ncbi:hypothetical protein, partial [Neosynechococcus sphagnicola]|uniref:hypothetical protein n=1 Tax=Neosynechococcus sphagnicola TaxID=1501145 RepID=UPI00055D837E